MINEREIAALVARFGMGNQLTGGVLLVDDEPNNLVVLRGVLEDEERWQVHVAATGDEALEVAGKVPLDVVVTDQRMPGMTGVDLLEKLRRLRPDIAGIVLTGYADMDALESAINRANAFRFLRKPWEPADILEAMRQACNHVSQRRIIERLVSLLSERGEMLRASFEEVKRQQQALLHLERIGTVGRLASGVTHDLRNMVTSLREAEYQLAQHSASPELRETFTLGLAHVERLLGTLRTLQDFAHAGKLEIVPAPADPADVVRDAVTISRMDLHFRLRRLVVDVEPGLPSLQADRLKLSQALVNLIQNSVQATGKDATVRISARALDGGAVELAVEDDGPGVAADFRPRLFQPFSAGKDSPGLGMGLYMARLIAESHGGSIRLVDPALGGARFELHVPATARND
ncbi:MAG: hybrid sensor histidine kinase/response regulator [Deltaproteobacteria bacterium]